MVIQEDRSIRPRGLAKPVVLTSVPRPRSKPGTKGQLPHRGSRPLENAIAGVALERSRSGDELNRLTRGLFEAQEEERRRIARELHDGLNQQLAILAVELGMLVRDVPSGEKKLRESLSTLRKRTEGLSDDLRSMTHQLHPAVLEHLGLIAALRSHCADFSQHEGIRVWFKSDPISGTPLDVSICLYRIVQEALRNVAKHSRAKEAWVSIKRKKGQIQLSIVDKGVGIDSAVVRKFTGLGLISIRERVQLVNGKLSISAPGKGTRIDVCVPITWKEEPK